jgi:hypothetical protein
MRGGLCKPNHRWGTQLVQYYFMHNRFKQWIRELAARLHEVSTRICARIDCAVRWIGTKIKEPPSFHGINYLETFLTQYEEKLLDNQILLALDLALKATPTRWWGAHKENIRNWYQCKRLLRIRFDAKKKNNKQQRYEGLGIPAKHLEE